MLLFTTLFALCSLQASESLENQIHCPALRSELLCMFEQDNALRRKLLTLQDTELQTFYSNVVVPGQRQNKSYEENY